MGNLHDSKQHNAFQMDRKKPYDGVSVLRTKAGTKVRTIGGLGGFQTVASSLSSSR